MFVDTFKVFIDLIFLPRRMHHVQSSHKSNLVLFVNSVLPATIISLLVGDATEVTDTKFHNLLGFLFRIFIKSACSILFKEACKCQIFRVYECFLFFRS